MAIIGTLALLGFAAFTSSGLAASTPPPVYTAIDSCLVKHHFKVQKSHGAHIGWYMVASVAYPTATSGVNGYDVASISVQPTVAAAKEAAKTFHAFSQVEVTRVGKVAYSWGLQPQLPAHASALAACVAQAVR
jgi:O-acetyl-ADP-ribose deacetylase (regulator of RNase III)